MWVGLVVICALAIDFRSKVVTLALLTPFAVSLVLIYVVKDEAFWGRLIFQGYLLFVGFGIIGISVYLQFFPTPEMEVGSVHEVLVKVSNIPPSAIPLMVARLQDTQRVSQRESERYEAVIKGFGDVAIPYLSMLLSEPKNREQPCVYPEAARLLAQAGKPAVEHIRGFLRSNSPHARSCGEIARSHLDPLLRVELTRNY